MCFVRPSHSTIEVIPEDVYEETKELTIPEVNID